MAKTRFSQAKEIDRTQIITDPTRFQGRQGEYSEDTVNAIVSKGNYDRTAEPIIVWYDAAIGKYIVISGHSRYEATRRLFKSGAQPDLKTLPVKEFLGDEDDAIDYATLESNRGSTEEGLLSDITAYRQAVKRGFNKARLMQIFKPESKLRKLQDLSFVTPTGRFIEALASDSARSYPYLERNARWMGQLRKALPRLTDAHEAEIFRYLYSDGSKKGLNLGKDKFFDLIDKRVNRIDFDPEKPLNLNNRVSSNALTDPIVEQIKDLQQETEKLQKEIQKKRENIVKARREGKENLISGFKQQIQDLEAIILRKLNEINDLQNAKGKVERETVFDLFSTPEPEPAKKEPAKKTNNKDGKKPPKYPINSLVNIIIGNKKHFGVKVAETSYFEGNFFRANHYKYKLEGFNNFHRENVLEPFDSKTQNKNTTENAYPVADPDGRLWQLAEYAWNGSTMSDPRERGQRYMLELERELQSEKLRLQKIAEKHGTTAEVQAEWGRYVKKYRDYAQQYLSLQSRAMSSMVTGPANFPVQKMEKINNRQFDLSKKWQEWEGKAMSRIEKTLKNIPVVTQHAPSDELNNQREKLKELQKTQEYYKAINAAYRKWKKNPDSLKNEPADIQKIITKTKAAIPSYMLTNNNANINRVKGRIAELSQRAAIKTKDGNNKTYTVDDIDVVINQEENRVQIIFPGKPDEERRKELKKNGFKWAPSKNAWQRMITNNALSALKDISFLKINNLHQAFNENEPSDAIKEKKAKLSPDIAIHASTIRKFVKEKFADTYTAKVMRGSGLSDTRITIEKKDKTPLNTYIKKWFADTLKSDATVNAYAIIIYLGDLQKVLNAIEEEKQPAPDVCPPMNKDGKRDISALGIAKLRKCIEAQPETKTLHINDAGEYNDERKKLHRKIIGKEKDQNVCVKQRQPIAILTGGAPGSGKTTFLKKFAPWATGEKIYRIDADEVRAKLPEYKGWNAEATHEETSDIINQFLTEIGDPCEYDLIYDGTMNKAKKYLPLIARLKKLGYKVFVVYMQVPKETSKKRVLDRYQRSGRYVPMHVIDEVYKRGLEAYENVIKEADGYVRVDGLTQQITEKGGMQIPKDREQTKRKQASETKNSPKTAKRNNPTDKEVERVQNLRKEIGQFFVMSEDQVLLYAREIHKLRRAASQTLDNSKINKKVLPATFDGLVQWAKNPGRYDIAAVDAPANTKTTVKPKTNKKVSNTNSGAGGFWSKIWNG